MTADGPSQQQLVFTVERGAGLREIADGLAAEGAISHPLVFIAMAKARGAAAALKAGDYEIPARASMTDVLQLITEGHASHLRLVVPEGLTVIEVVALIDEFRERGVLLGAVDAVPPEGSLAPDTYFLNRGQTAQAVIDRMRSAQSRRLEAAWEARSEDLPLASPEEALILASIIEKETGLDGERHKVASVFINRLKKGMRLQSDPTVVYGVTGGAGALGRGLTKTELRTPTPYNTYTIAALPPTPIANPGEAAIQAALNPADTPYFYFVADGTGGHGFSRTYSEHKVKVQEWRKIERARKEAASNG